MTQVTKTGSQPQAAVHLELKQTGVSSVTVSDFSVPVPAVFNILDSDSSSYTQI